MEFELIERIRARVVARADVVLGIGDDAAVLAVPPGRQLVVTTDTLNAGVHFPDDTAPSDIGWKALAVNLSDLAAMGAEPAWCTLSLSLPGQDAAWLDGFLDGFLALAARHGMALVGGDTTRGSLSVGVTVHGLVAPGRALRRDGAVVGDDVWVTGTLGDAAAGLRLLQHGGPAVVVACEAGPVLEAETDAGASALLRARLDRPEPRLAAGLGLVGVASSAIDVSDGLAADLGHVCRASGVGAEVRLAALPVSDALLQAFPGAERPALQAAGGDDYELCFTAPAAMRQRVETIGAEARTRVTRIGRVVAGGAVRLLDADGVEWQPARPGYEHFAD